jgi:hypothetical protein
MCGVVADLLVELAKWWTACCVIIEWCLLAQQLPVMCSMNGSRSVPAYLTRHLGVTRPEGCGFHAQLSQYQLRFALLHVKHFQSDQGTMPRYVLSCPYDVSACSFEIKVSASAEGRPLHTLTGDLTATAAVEAVPPTSPAAAAATQDVASAPFPYEFTPKLQPSSANSSNSSSNGTAGTGSPTPANGAVTSETASGIRNLAVGSCADLSAGVIVAEELPLDAAAAATAVAAAGANGTTADGRGGKCLRVCGLEFREGTNVTVMTPLTGFAQQQCGTTQVR